jgi:toxin ParE1/3/4
VKPVRVLSRAKADLKSIGDYIALDNPDKSVAFVAEIERRCKLLGEFPELARRIDSAAGELRLLPFKRYVIVYRIQARNIEILRILHGSRDLSHLLEDPDELE